MSSRLQRGTQKAIITLAVLLIVGGVAFGIRTAYFRSPQHQKTLVFSNNAMLLELWDNYKINNLNKTDHRTIDKQAGGITTSEGEGYTMLRATWIDDRTTFDQNWNWTQKYLQRSDKLFSWKYGPLGNGKYGVQTSAGGNNTASDGDSDIALSLLMAYSRWGDTTYLRAAEQIIPSIWQNEVVSVAGKPILAADDLERSSPTSIVVNPSYLAPYAYKIFATIDPSHDWKGLTDNSYTVLDSLAKNPLDSATSSGLEPDWIVMNRTTGVATAGTAPNLDTNYSYDAMRTSWRLALDYQWFNDSRDKAVLSNFKFLSKEYRLTGQLQATYDRSGTVISKYESPAGYGSAIGYFLVEDPTFAQKMYNVKLLSLYSPDAQGWATKMSYYDDNWTWFGLALAQHALPNLTEHS